jgi:hypothetical protein
VTTATIKNCWIKCRIADGATMSTIRNAGDYMAPIDVGVVADLAEMMDKMDVGSVDAYLDIEDGVDVHEPDDEIVDLAEEADADDEEEEEPAISAAVALKHCMEISRFLVQCGGEAVDVLKNLQCVTNVVRSEVTNRKKQQTMLDFLV